MSGRETLRSGTHLCVQASGMDWAHSSAVICGHNEDCCGHQLSRHLIFRLKIPTVFNFQCVRPRMIHLAPRAKLAEQFLNEIQIRKLAIDVQNSPDYLEQVLQVAGLAHNQSQVCVICVIGHAANQQALAISAIRIYR
ncbi:hypothetical protein CBL_01807 [Carabus blaptoides fortunei]